MKKRLSIEQKGMIEDILTAIMKLLSIDLFRVKINEMVQSHYDKGLEVVGVKFKMNFTPNDRDISFLNDYVMNNMKYHTDQLGNKLRQEISRAMLEKETTEQLKKRIKQVFDDDKYFDRLKTVLRTETLRANNMGQLEGARQSRIPTKKYLSVIMDDRTSDICIAEHAKYGSKDQAIPLEEEFKIHVDGKDFNAMQPTFHPNCRSVLQFVRTDVEQT